MNILVIGGGGREHAIIKSIKKNKDVTKIYALPGNGGIAQDATCVDIKATDLDSIVEFAKNNPVDFAVVAPDDPLVMGCVDELEILGIPCFGPNARAAIIEGSKVFSKEIMKKYSIPTGDYAVFSDMEQALAYLETCKIPIVIKPDGLALGKGVIICENLQQAQKAVKTIMQDKVFGKSGDSIVIEEFLTGPEVSVLAFTDGKAMVPMVSSMDHKRALDGDKGLNTGGMGTVAPNPYYTDEVAKRCMDEIFLPTMRAMNEEERTFKGCLYFGLMLTPEGPKVIEYNCRFGDPETQVVLPLMKTDLLNVMQAVANETLGGIKVEFEDKSACCVVIASGGYPGSYESGKEITFKDPEALIFHAGTKSENSKIVTAGGRVLGVTAVGDSLQGAIDAAYSSVKTVSFDGGFYRSDIGKRALSAKSEI